MASRGVAARSKAYLATLVATILFPLVWAKALRIARRHADDDPRGRAKVLFAIAAGIAIAVVGFGALFAMQAAARDGFYESFDKRLQIYTGEAAYQERVTSIDAANKQIPLLEGQLPAARGLVEAERQRVLDAGGDPDADEAYAKANATLANLEKSLAAAHTTLEKANAELRGTTLLAPDDTPDPHVGLNENHALYERVKPLAAARDDDAVRQAFAAYVEGVQSGQPKAVHEVSPGLLEAGIAVKDKAERDMQAILWWIAYPSVAGAFFAPLAFALGSILRNAFAESDTVGYKPYPGAAAGWFLLLGAFGAPSIPVAAWVFTDMQQRSETGQIAL